MSSDRDDSADDESAVDLETAPLEPPGFGANDKHKRKMAAASRKANKKKRK